MPTNVNGNSTVYMAVKDGKPITTAFFSIYDMERDINGKLYFNTFTNIKDAQNFDAYSEISINTDVGIVAFRDVNNEMWSFVRFE